MELATSDQMKSYFNALEEEVRRIYQVAQEARRKGLDPEPEVEIHLAK
ncbi:MAG: hypothetical protein DRO63_07360, partial [Candidatus Gerdarchaeota archaeon]